MPCVSSGHVLSETAGARNPFVGGRLIPSRRQAGPQGACIDGEDRVLSGPRSRGFVISVRTFCPAAGSRPAPGTGASRCGEAFVEGAARHVQ